MYVRSYKLSYTLVSIDTAAVALQEEQVIKRFGFLYGGYAFPYWEVADMVRKLAVAAIPVFIKVQPLGSLQAVLGEIVLVIYIFVVSYLKPFGNPHDNLLQVGSMLGKEISHTQM